MKKKPKILVVDDERFHLNVIIDLLSSDYDILVAKNGERALEIARSAVPPDLILLDILMPEMDGYEVCKQLKANEKTATIPVIFLTVKRDVADETQGFALGAVDYITKPFSPPIVKARVNTHIALSNALHELENQNEQLELRVNERTRDILRAQQEQEQLQLRLQQTQKLSAIGQLTSGIAHDFNNILFTISGYTDLALTNLTSDHKTELPEYLNHIHQAGIHASELVEQLLEFSRGVPSKAQPINLARLVTDIIKLLRPLLSPSINLDIHLTDNVPTILSDKIQMHQVIVNLCINARDAMDGKGCLSITLKNRKKITSLCSACRSPINGDFVELTVTDDGSGFEPAIAEHIFEPFFSTKKSMKGTGMGLSMVNDIVHQHHGHIVVESTLNKGTTFRLLFPPKIATSIEQNIPNEENSMPLTIARSHILLVDNDMSFMFLLKELLEASNYRITTCNDGNDALDKITTQINAFDLLITGQNTPGITGVTLARTLCDKNIHLPTVLCSGSELPDQIRGVTRILTKPLKSKHLIQVIQELLTNEIVDA